MKKIITILFFSLIVSTIAYAQNFSLDEIMNEAKKETFGIRLRKEGVIVEEEIGTAGINEAKNDSELIRIAQENAYIKVLDRNNCQEIKATTLGNYSKDRVIGEDSSITSKDSNKIQSITNYKSIPCKIDIIPGTQKKDSTQFSAKFKLIFFYNKFLQIKSFCPDSFLYSLSNSMLSDIEKELGSFKNDFKIMHYSDKYNISPGYILKISEVKGEYTPKSKGTNYDVTISAELANNNPDYEGSTSFRAKGSSRKRIKGLFGSLMAPMSGLSQVNNRGETTLDYLTSSKSESHSSFIEESNNILSIGRNDEGFREAANAAIKDLCAQIHMYVSKQ